MLNHGLSTISEYISPGVRRTHKVFQYTHIMYSILNLYEIIVINWIIMAKC